VKYIPSLRLIDAIYLPTGDAGYRAHISVRRGVDRAGRYIRFTHMATVPGLSLDRDAPWLALLHSTSTGAI
jgi:hypothetical protein